MSSERVWRFVPVVGKRYPSQVVGAVCPWAATNMRTAAMPGLRVCRACCHDKSRMKTWLLVLVAVTALGLLLQVALILKERPLTWPLHALAGPPSANGSNSSGRAVELTRGVPAHGGGGGGGGSRAHHPYRFVLNEPGACSNETELVMVVITAAGNAQQRQAVRDTWGSLGGGDPARRRVARVFLVGATPDPQLQARLEEESRRHRDIVQEDFLDTYRNLSVKSLGLLRWVTLFCNSSTFVLKADDDMYVNVSNLVGALRQERLSTPAFILGCVFVGSRPIQDRSSKWYTPREDFKEKEYPRYTSGTAYAMTTSAAFRLYAASADVPLFWLEDVYITGLVARKAGVPVHNHGGFTHKKPKVDGCHFRKAITGHRYSAQEMRTIFQLINDPSLKC